LQRRKTYGLKMGMVKFIRPFDEIIILETIKTL